MPQSAVHGLCSTPTDTRASMDGKGAGESGSWSGSKRELEREQVSTTEVPYAVHVPNSDSALLSVQV